MRVLPVLFVALACSGVANARDKVPAEASPAPVAVSASPAASAAAPTGTGAPSGPAQADTAEPARRTRLTWEQRFAQANATHDGHLTLEQAKAGYATVARRFDEIDLTKKGYVTEDDIRAWHKAQRTRRGQSADASTLQPTQAFQRFFPSTSPVNTASGRIVPTGQTPADPTAMMPVSPAPEGSAGNDAPL